jgi:hypothetical protein
MSSLRDFGLTSGSEKIQVEHILVLTLSPALDETMRKWVKLCSESSRSTLKAIHVIGCGLAAYLVLAGVSKIIDSLRKNNRPKIE